MNRDAQIVIGPDGVVLAVSGDRPAGGVDTHLADGHALPAQVREAAGGLLAQRRRSGGLGNALRYVRAGSRRMTRGHIKVRASYDAAQSRLTIDVEDDGRGIPPDTVARLFKRDGLDLRGADLSLLVISDICAAHAGSIEVDSRIDENHGTRIRLSLTV